VGGKFSRAFPRFCSHRARLQKTRALSSFRQTLFRDSPAATESVCQSLEIFAPPIRRSLCRRGACAARNPLARLGSSPQTLPLLPPLDAFCFDSVSYREKKCIPKNIAPTAFLIEKLIVLYCIVYKLQTAKSK